jgi:adenylate cyclase
VTGARVERRLAKVLAADVAGYSRLMGADEVGTLAALGSSLIECSHQTMARPKFKLSDIARLTNLGSRTNLAL